MGIAARLVFGRPTDDDWLVVFHELGHHRFDHMLTRRSCVRLGTIATQLDRGMVAAWRSVGWQCGVDAKIRINSRRIIRRALLSTGLKHANWWGFTNCLRTCLREQCLQKCLGGLPSRWRIPTMRCCFRCVCTTWSIQGCLLRRNRSSRERRCTLMAATPSGCEYESS